MIRDQIIEVADALQAYGTKGFGSEFVQSAIRRVLNHAPGEMSPLVAMSNDPSTPEPKRRVVNELLALLGAIYGGNVEIGAKEIAERIRQLTEAALGNKQELVQEPASPSSLINDERGEFVYERAMNGTGWSQIGAAVRKKWGDDLTPNGVKNIALRYADRNELPRPPKRNRGRPKNTK